MEYSPRDALLLRILVNALYIVEDDWSYYDNSGFNTQSLHSIWHLQKAWNEAMGAVVRYEDTL